MDNNIYAISYKMRQELYRRIASISKIILICFVAISIFMNFLLYPVLSRSNSMSPDISAGSVEFVVPFLRTPSRGDVVLVQNHGSADLNIVKRFLNQCFLFVTALPMLRRVVGMPGDTIYIDKYVVYIKPKGESHFLTEFELIDKKYDVEIFTAPTGWDINLGAKSGTKQIVLGDGQYYLLGDNRMECMDSRLWGAVKKSAIKGRVVLQYFPFNKIKAF